VPTERESSVAVEPSPRFAIVPLDVRRHDREAFTCGDEGLDRYLQHQASQDMRRKANAVFVLSPDDAPDFIAGYYALCGVGVDPGRVPSELAKKLPRYPQMSATLLSRLAVASALHGRGLGGIMLVDALQRAHRASAEVGSVMVVTDPVDATAEAFYAHFGFQKLSGVNRMFVLMATIARL